MDTLDVLLICLKRWYVFLLLLLLAFFTSLGLGNDQRRVYSGTGNFAVIYRAPPPVTPKQVDPRTANPMAAGDGSLLKQSIVNDLRSAKSQRELAGPGVIGTDPSTPADGSLFAVVTTATSATVTITTFGPSQAVAKATVDRVLTAAQERATTIQDRVGAPPTGRLTTFVTLPAQTTVLPPPSKIKLVVAVMAVGVIAGAGLSLLLDRLMSKRREGRNDVPQEGRGKAWWRRRRKGADDVSWPPQADPGHVAQDDLAARAGSPTHLARANRETLGAQETG